MKRLAFLLFALFALNCGEAPADEHEMADRPATDVRWAESAPNPAADRIFPTDKQAEGYVFEEAFPHEDFNGYAYEVGRHINYLERSAGSYEYPGDALTVEGFAAGDTVVMPGLSGQAVVGDAGVDFTNSPISMTTDGVFLIVVEDTSSVGPVYPRIHVIDPSGVIANRVFTVTTPSVFESPSIACNGAQIAVSDGHEVVVVDYDGVVIHASLSHGAEILDIAMDNERVYAVGAVSGGVEARAWTLATGAVTWTYAHGATLRRVVTDGLQVWAAGSANGALETMVRISAVFGGANGTGSSTAAADSFVFAKGIALGRDALYVITSTNKLERVEKWASMNTIDSLTFNNTIRNLSVDDKYVYVTTDNGTPSDNTFVMPADTDLRSIWLGWQMFSNRAALSMANRVFGIYDNGASGTLQVASTRRGPILMKYTGAQPAATGYLRTRFEPGD